MKKIILSLISLFLISSIAHAGRLESSLKIAGEAIKQISHPVRVTPGFKPDKQPPVDLKRVSPRILPTRVKWLDYDRGHYIPLEPWSWNKIKKDFKELLFGKNN